MESDRKDYSRGPEARPGVGPFDEGPDPQADSSGKALPDGWTRPATAQNQIRPAEPTPPTTARRSNPMLPLGLVALSLVLALLALAFALQT